jgi:hypothetical protein
MKQILYILLIAIPTISFCQELKVKIIEVDSIDYYYVYKAIEREKADTITILSNKFKDNESDVIALDENNYYDLKTRFKSSIKTSLDKYLFCNPGITTINNIRISDESSLPVLILEYTKKQSCKPTDSIHREFKNTFNDNNQRLILFRDSTFVFIWNSKSIDLLGGESYGKWSKKDKFLILNSFNNNNNNNNRIDSIIYTKQNFCPIVNSYDKNLIRTSENKDLIEKHCEDLMQIKFINSEGFESFMFGTIYIDNDQTKSTRIEVFPSTNDSNGEVFGFIKKQRINSLTVQYDSWLPPFKIKLDNNENNSIKIFGNFVQGRGYILNNEKWKVSKDSIFDNQKYGNLVGK